MKKNILVFILLVFCTAAVAQAQDSLQLKKTIAYKIKLQEKSGKNVRGYLKQVTDSSVVYSIDKTSYGATPQVSDKTVHYSLIKNLLLRRTGKTGRAMAIGAGIGVATGAIIGLASGDSEPTQGYWSFGPTTAGEKAAAFAIVLGIAGTAIGALSGIASRQYTIDGKIENLAVLRLEMQKKTYGISTSSAIQQ